MSRKRRTLDEFMESTRKLISNTLSDEEIKALVLPYKYDETRLNQGMTLYNETYSAFENTKREYANQVEARLKIDEVFKQANDEYIEQIGLARLALEGKPAKQQLLAIDGKRADSMSGWLMQANRFYGNMIDNQEILAAVARFGLTNEKLVETQKKIKTIETENDQHDKARGTAQQSLVDRNKLKKQMQRWAYEFTKVCRFALKEKPQLLEKLGITKLSEGYVKQSTVRKAKEKAQEKEKAEAQEKEKENVNP